MKFKIECDHNAYYYPFKIYIKDGFFSRWKHFRDGLGYESVDKCIEAIEKFLADEEKANNINKELKERERRKDR